jgi:hypothetical protein
VFIGLFLWGFYTPSLAGRLPPPRPSPPGQLLYWTIAIGYLLVTHLVAASLATPRSARRDWSWFVAGGAAAVALGVWHYLAVETGLPFPGGIVYSNPTFGSTGITRVRGILRFMGPFPEPSMYAIYGSFATAVAYGLRRYRLAAIFAASLVLALSTTAIIGLVVLAGLVILHNRNEPAVKYFILGSLGVLVVFLLIPPIREALLHLTIGKVDSNSIRIRSMQLLAGLRAWTVHPILGWGIGAERTNDGLSHVLLNLGLLGTSLLAVLFGRTALTRDERYGQLGTGLKIAFVTVVVLHILSGPDVTKPYLWVLAGYVTALPLTDGEAASTDRLSPRHAILADMDLGNDALALRIAAAFRRAYEHSLLKTRAVDPTTAIIRESLIARLAVRVVDNEDARP